MTHRRAHVTDHALVRYLERVEGIDMDAVRKTIETTVQRGIDSGADGVRLNGIRFALQNDAVVTVTRIHHPDHRTGGHRGRRGDHDG